MSDDRPTVTLTIDGRTVTVPRGTTVWQAARAAGIDIPVFCYHDRMPPLGACRQCLVQVEGMPRLQTSCTLVAQDRMVVHATSPEARAAQERILEFLLINHPLDCPICDKGGECPLQDQAFAYGPGRSRFIELKRDFAKPVSLGPVLVLDRERCVLCWRCVRFGELVAGDDALKGFERGFQTEIDTPFTRPVRSKFIGNTIAICPVGALTSKAFRFLARPWDVRPVPSVCTQCGLGCALTLDVRDGRVARVRPREAPPVNDVWLCDLGQFGYEYLHAPDRLTQPLVRRDGELRPATWREALDLVADRLRAAREADPRRVAALGGTRLTNEDCHLVRRLFGELVGTPHLDHRVDARPGSPSLRLPWGLRTPLAAIDGADWHLLVGCDLTEEYPIAWLRLKRAIDAGAAAFAVHPRALEIDRHLRGQVHPVPGGEAVVLAQLADALAGGTLDGTALQQVDVPPEVVERMVETLRAARRPMLYLGRAALEGPSGEAVLAAARRLHEAGAVVHVMRGKGNAWGAALMGVQPGPGGWTAPEILRHAGEAGVDVLYVLGADPATEVPDHAAWEAARRATPFLVVHDLFLTATAATADVVLPALAFAERDGTVTTIEGRVQRLAAAVRGPGEARADGDILLALADRLGAEWAYAGWEEVFREAAARVPGLAVDAVLTPPPLPDGWAAEVRLPGEAHRPWPGEAWWLLTGEVLFDRGSMSGRAPRIADLAEEPVVVLHPEDAATSGLQPGALVEVAALPPAQPAGSAAGAADGEAAAAPDTHPRGAERALVVRLALDPAVPRGRAWLPRAFDAVPVRRLLSWDEPAPRVAVRALQPAVPATGARP